MRFAAKKKRGHLLALCISFTLLTVSNTFIVGNHLWDVLGPVLFTIPHLRVKIWHLNAFRPFPQKRSHPRKVPGIEFGDTSERIGFDTVEITTSGAVRET